MPEVSIIIPAYNAAKTIHLAIESVIAQTFKDFELIIVNDGSTDTTFEVVNAFQDQRIILLDCPNSGSYPSRNQGMTHAKGNLIAFMDADDLWLKHKLEAQVKALQDNPKAGLAYCWTDWIDIFGKPLNKGVYTSHKGNVLAKLLLGNFIANGSNPLVRKIALDRVGAFAEDIVSGADWDMWLRLAIHYEFVCIPHAYVLHRRSNDSWSANLFRLEKGSLEVIERGYKRAPANLQKLKRQTKKRFYLYLTRRALTILPDTERYFTQYHRGQAAAKFFFLTLWYDFSQLIYRPRLFGSLFWRITVMLFRNRKTNT